MKILKRFLLKKTKNKRIVYVKTLIIHCHTNNQVKKERSKMANGVYIQARIDPQIKEDARGVLDELGITMSEAIVVYLRQIILRRAIPFELKLPNELTVKTLEKSEKGEDLHEFSNVDDLLKELHC